MHKKKLFMQIMSVRWIPIYAVNLDNFEESWIFGYLKRPFWTPVAPKRDMMWYDIDTMRLSVQLIAETVGTNQSETLIHSTRHLIGSRKRLLQTVSATTYRGIRFYVFFLSYLENWNNFYLLSLFNDWICMAHSLSQPWKL